MTVTVVAAFILMAMAATCGLACAVTTMEIADAVNAKAPESQQVSPVGWYAAKSERVFRQYRELYPQGTMVRRAGILAILAMASFVGCISFILPAWMAIFLGAGSAGMIWLTFFQQ